MMAGSCGQQQRLAENANIHGQSSDPSGTYGHLSSANYGAISQPSVNHTHSG